MTTQSFDALLPAGDVISVYGYEHMLTLRLMDWFFGHHRHTRKS
ncbi:MAG: hypothetical protein PUK32_05355 [Sutterella sp.]|nr:hypothetical protein [Sutterella sp.]